MTVSPMRHFHIRLLFVFLAAVPFALGGCNPASSPSKVSSSAKSAKTRTAPTTRIRFKDVTAKSGVNFTARNGQQRGYLAILETLGTGAALADFDGDGDLDLLTVGGGTFDDKPQPVGLPSALWSNDGNCRFSDVTSKAGLTTPPFYTHAAIASDYDNDGFTDVLITGYRGLQLYHNNGDGTFTDVSDHTGIKSDQWNTAAGWGDFDGDGNLDLFLVRYVDWSFEKHPVCPLGAGKFDVCSPLLFQARTDVVFRSNGDGTFRDASQETGLVPGGKGLGLVLGDVDLDGDLDAYVANDTTPNFLYLNDGKGKLVESGIPSGTALGEGASSDGSMGVDLGDYNNDGRPDIWVANYEEQLFAMYRNEGNASFEHVSSHVGIGTIGSVYVGFGTVFLDADLDGDLDLFATNGHVMRHPRNSPVFQLPLLLENQGKRGFANVAARVGDYLKRKHMGRGVARGDLDGDGDIDLVVTHINQPVAILSNETATVGKPLKIRLIGTRSSRDPVGAIVTLKTKDSLQLRLVKSGGSFLSSSPSILTFALGRQHQDLELTIRWPSGQKQSLKNVSGKSTLVLIEPIAK